MDDLPNEIKQRIASCLDDRSLALLSSVNSFWSGAATLVLYKRDARAGGRNTRAILEAVRVGCNLNDETVRETALTIFDRSRYFDSDINAQVGNDDAYATPLMLAASANTEQNYFWIYKLLQEGASASIESKSFLRNRNIALGSLSPRSQVQGKKLPTGHTLRKLKQEFINDAEFTVPLFLPIVQGNREAARLLLNEGDADARLASAQPMASGGTALTAIHVAAFSGDDDSDFVRKALKKFPFLLNAEYPSTSTPGTTALHLAILSLSKEVFSMLLKAGPDLNAEMGILRRPPLHVVIEQMHEEEDQDNLKTLKNFAQQLLEAGANVDRPLPVGLGYTPLMALIEKMKSRRKWPRKMRETAELFLKHGANTNFIALNGFTPLRLLTDVFMSEMTPGSVQKEASKLLQICIDDHEARPNSFTVGTYSLLGHVLGRHITKGFGQGDLLKVLTSHDATLTGPEANYYFRHWICDNDILRDECRGLYDMGLHRAEIDQRQIDKAYKKVFERDTPGKELQYLLDRFPPPSDASPVLWQAFLPENYQIPIVKKLLTLDFDGRYIHPREKTGLVTQLIRIVCNVDFKYTQKLATEQCKTLIEHGASVLHTDLEGLTPIQFLRRSAPADKKLESLLLFLHDEKDKELGEF